MTELCGYCGEEVAADDSFEIIPHFDIEVIERRYHTPCAMRLVTGGLNHILGRCICCGGSEPPDPPDLTRRQAAAAAVVAWQRRSVGG